MELQVILVEKLHEFVLSKTINPHFLQFLMQSDFFQHYLGNAEVGTTTSRIFILRFFGCYMLCSIPQRAEDHFLSSGIESIEETLSVGFRELEKLRLLKAALMQDLLTGKVRVTPLLDKEERIA